MEKLGFTCLIGLDRSEEIDQHALQNAFSSISPRSSLKITGDSVHPEASQVLAVDVDGHSLTAVLFEDYIPEDDYDLAAAKSLFWPEGGEAMSTHTAFIAVSAHEQEGVHGLARAQAVAVTRLVAGLCEALPASGVLWVPARTFTAPQDVVRAVTGLTRGHWPVNLWLGWFGHGQVGQDTSVVGYQTQGAAAFLGFELYCEAFKTDDILEPLRLLYITAGHLLAKGNVIPDGQIVEVAGERRTEYKLIVDPEGGPGVARLRVLERDHRKMH